MKKNPIPFGEWTPDAGVLASTATEAKGVYSMGGRYMPLKGTTSYGATARLNDRALGYFGAVQSNGSIVNFFGDRNRLYKMVNRTMTDVSRIGGYAADGDAAWRFDQYNDYVIATCRGAPAQVLELGGTGTFNDLGGESGEGDTCGRIGPHFLIAQGRELRISAFNNPTDYVPAPDTQAALAILDQRGGLCQAIVGGTDVGVIFQERMISRMTYVGGATAFQMDPVEFNRGCLGPLAVARLGRLMFYASEEGIFIFDGVQSTPIGANKIDRYFNSRLNYTYRNRVSCAIDTERKCFMVAYPTGTNADITEMLIYSIPDQRWTRDDYTGHLLFEMPKEGVSIDDTEAIVAAVGTADLDSVSVSIDAPIWRETRKQWGAVDQDRYVVLFDGATRPATIETAEAELAPGRQGFVTELMPVTDATPVNVTAQIATKAHRFDQSLSWSPTSTMNAYGSCPVRAQGRYMRARMSIAQGASWTEAHGVHTDARLAGER